jgi:hypothetical protein
LQYLYILIIKFNFIVITAPPIPVTPVVDKKPAKKVEKVRKAPKATSIKPVSFFLT